MDPESRQRDGRGAPRRSGTITPWRAVVYSLLPAIVLFGGAEIALRVAGFEFHTIPRHFQFGANVDHDLRRNLAVPDIDLFWRLNVREDTAAFLIRQRHVHPDLRSPTGADRHSPGTLRVVAMGDSCTFFGTPPYPRTLERRLLDRGLDGEVFSAAVPGYTSHQGRRWFESEVVDYHPDWVTVYYGWNDHWLAMRTTDRELDRTMTLAGTLAARLAAHVRLVQAALYVRARLSRPPPEGRPYRVPIDDYRDNLEALCRGIREAGATAIFVTAPSELDPDDLRRLQDEGQIRPGADVTGLHEAYNEVVRDVATACGAELVDFAAAASRTHGFVSNDGIHLTPQGIDWLALQLDQRIAVAPTGGNG
jgi:lysophospholipase L1-like esterase